MTHNEAKQTFFEFLLYNMPRPDAPVEDLYLWAYVKALSMRTPIPAGARTIVHAFGAVKSDVDRIAQETAFDLVRDYLIETVRYWKDAWRLVEIKNERKYELLFLIWFEGWLHDPAYYEKLFGDRPPRFWWR
jgi:hypothetical protein